MRPTEPQDALMAGWLRAIDFDDELDRRRAVKRPCQVCGQPAEYRPPHPDRRRKHRRVADAGHDLCWDCWRKLRASVDADSKTVAA